MTALSVSTSMISWSATTWSPGFTLMETMVASAIDSPSCGMVIGIWGITLLGQNLARFLHDGLRARTVGAPKIRMIGNGRILGVDPCGRGIEQMKSLGGDASNDLRGHTAPGE